MTPSETTTACLGVMCPGHGECKRYYAGTVLNFMGERGGTCFDGKTFPLFEQVEKITESEMEPK